MRAPLLLMLGLVACQSDPTLSGRLAPRTYGGLMFVRTPAGFGSPELYRLPPDQGPAVRVEPRLVAGTESSTSLDGEWFTWSDEGTTWVRRLRGTDARRVTPAGAIDGRPHISSDGRRIILMRTRPGQPGGPVPLITIVDRTTLEERQFTLVDQMSGDPALAPNGQIVWRSETRSNGLELLDGNGQPLRVLRTNSYGFRGTHSPAFSPDGQRIVFVERSFDSPGTVVTVINLDGDTQLTWQVDEYAIQPAWSPDGTQIAVCLRPEDSGTSRDQVVIWHLVSGEKVPIPTGGASDCYPAWGR